MINILYYQHLQSFLSEWDVVGLVLSHRKKHGHTAVQKLSFYRLHKSRYTRMLCDQENRREISQNRKEQ
jgi:hypothetical protein